MMIENKIIYPCPICGSKKYKTIYPDTLGNDLPEFGYNFSPNHSKTYRIVLCLNCKHGYTSPRSEIISNNYEDIEDNIYLGNSSSRIETAKKVVNILKCYIPTGKLLDIGCSTGDFLSVAQNIYEVNGLELSKWASNIAEKRGFIIYKHKLEKLGKSDSYDIITLWGVIEHLEEPDKEIKKMNEILKKGGIICLWTGNFMCFLSKILGRKWWWIQGQHIQYFSRNSLIKLFENNGFKKVWIGRYPYVMSIKSIAKSLNRYSFLGKITESLLNIPIINVLKRITITIKLPGEMFAIFRKL